MRRIYKSVPYEYVICRTLLHAWEDISGITPKKKVEYLHGKRITLRCTRCSTTREDIISTVTGDLMARIYEYPNNYRVSRDELPEDMTLRQAMRLEMLKRPRSANPSKSRSRVG